MKKTIGELLFDGYEDAVMEIGSSLDGDEDDYFEDEEGETKQEPNKVPLDKFGWFYKVRKITKNVQNKLWKQTCMNELTNYRSET